MKLKLLIGLSLFCIFSWSFVKAQVYTYYLDNNLSSVTKDKAIMLGKGSRQNDLFKLDCYSLKGDQLYITLHCKDSTLSSLQGPYFSFHKNRKIEESGEYMSDSKEGAWQKWDSLGRKTDSTVYKNDLAMFQKTFRYHNNNVLSYQSLKDSLQDTFITFSYDSNAVLTQAASFLGNKGILRTYTSQGTTLDSVFTREEIETEFPGGQKEWSKYLRFNLNASTPQENGATNNGTYTVIVHFTILPDGNIVDIEAETAHGYGMEKEVFRIIRNSPKWVPAKQYGRYVKAYRKQPVTFVVQGQ